MKPDNIRRKELIEKIVAASGHRPGLRHRCKMLAWNFTIGLSYFLKRALDIFVSVIMLILLSPLFLITALAIYLEDPGPIFYTQVRVGKDGRHFDFYKFRTW